MNSNSGIEVTTGFFPMAWMLYMFTPVVEINGKKNSRKWGRHYFELEPGEYHVRIYFPYIMRPECGLNDIRVTVKEGHSNVIDYRMPGWMLAKGKIKEFKMRENKPRA